MYCMKWVIHATLKILHQVGDTCYLLIVFACTGAYDSTKWPSILHNLYDLLVNEINLISSRGKYSSGSRNIAVKENLIELMADICHQVTFLFEYMIDYTELYVLLKYSYLLSVICCVFLILYSLEMYYTVFPFCFLLACKYFSLLVNTAAFFSLNLHTF